MAPSTTDFNVQRCNPELIAPSEPTPFQVLRLSDLDSDCSIRRFVSSVHFYQYNPSMENKDPVKIIKDALARTLVYYYPLAGRLRESKDERRKLEVECTGEGALFIEAAADISIKDLGHPLHPPLPYYKEFVSWISGVGLEDEIFNSPPVHIQVTRLKCGGFVFGMQVCHNMMDGIGCNQFMNAITEIAKGAAGPSVPPIWQRELISARSPPRITCVHHEFDDQCGPVTMPNMAHRLIFFTREKISQLRKLAPDHLQKSCSSFDLMTTCLWRTRALALQLDPEEKIRLMFAMNMRHKYNPPLPEGYYGNAIASVLVTSTWKELRENSFGYALEKVIKAKKSFTDEYMRSFVDELVSRGYPVIELATRSFFISDLRRLGFHEVDFGWGKPLYGGPGDAWYEAYPQIESDFIMCKNSDGEDVTLAAICLPAPNMELFINELSQLIDI